MKTFALKLLDGTIVEVREHARVGEFVAHSPWDKPRGTKELTVTHAPTMTRLFTAPAKLVKAFIRGARSGRTLARIAAAQNLCYADPSWDCGPRDTRAWRALVRYCRTLEKKVLR